jgi:ElaB/YqjD/DUF883 family membrane-anchored ribosome-binding protein
MTITTANATRDIGQAATQLGDQAAQGAESAIRSTQRVANDALDNLSNSVEGVRAKAMPAISRVAGEAEQLARRGIDAVRDSSAHLRDQAMRAQDKTVGYIKEEPVKAMLIAAAAGAALMALVALLGRSSNAPR